MHLAALGRPIVGDLFYPVVVHGPGETEEDWQQPLRLLARGLAFTDPLSGQARCFESRQALAWPHRHNATS